MLKFQTQNFEILIIPPDGTSNFNMCSKRKMKLDSIFTPKIMLKVGRKWRSFHFNQAIAQSIMDEISKF